MHFLLAGSYKAFRNRINTLHTCSCFSSSNIGISNRGEETSENRKETLKSILTDYGTYHKELTLMENNILTVDFVDLWLMHL